MSSEVVLKVEHVGKRYEIYEAPHHRLLQTFLRGRKQFYKEFWALRDVSLELKQGECLGIVGRNGSGKSTLLQIIAGTLAPTTGRVHVAGKVAALLELGSGFNPDFTGRENVYMNGAVMGFSRAEMDEKFDEIAAFADIEEYMDQPVRVYSSGMQMRLAFSVATAHRPQVLIVDEALSVGDELFQRKCFSLIEAIRANGTAILLVSHSGSTLVELCDRALLIDAGEKLAGGVPKQIVGQYQKLLYAPADRREAIRAQICRTYECLGEPAAAASEVSLKNHSTVASVHELQECFDPNLKPSSTLEYESHGAYIESPAVLTLDGQQVNNLIRGKSYRYVYSVKFVKSASRVRFAMLIKTTSGLELGGAESASATQEGVPFIEQGTSYRVEFRFRCALNSGVYFLNAGVLGEVEGCSTYLHRVIDTALFRVLPEEGNIATAIIDFDCCPEIELQQVTERGEPGA